MKLRTLMLIAAIATGSRGRHGIRIADGLGARGQGRGWRPGKSAAPLRRSSI
ncbi:hypothetical protein [Burkholderia gladioli]|uniref:hypothetical protein n=1 Tax=Burkholderia gladioli TaxID=28095 RepID=UPI0016404AB5|nr:hypothetical protein [Burkholderia gladioli]MDA0575050.1 hypothetical protein [Burkholderia gladioli]MDA0603094.1 hypothetical protein [Burkholderia gladioli]